MLLHTCGNGNAMAIANAVELEGCRMGERIANHDHPSKGWFAHGL